MGSKNIGFGKSLQSNLFFETTHSLESYLPKKWVEYYFSHWLRISYGGQINKISYTSTVSVKDAAYFWGKLVDEIVEDHHRFSLAKISIETDIDLHFIGKVWVGQINCMPLDFGQKLFTLHEKLRPDLQ